MYCILVINYLFEKIRFPPIEWNPGRRGGAGKPGKKLFGTPGNLPCLSKSPGHQRNTDSERQKVTKGVSGKTSGLAKKGPPKGRHYYIARSGIPRSAGVQIKKK